MEPQEQELFDEIWWIWNIYEAYIYEQEWYPLNPAWKLMETYYIYTYIYICVDGTNYDGHIWNDGDLPEACLINEDLKKQEQEWNQ